MTADTLASLETLLGSLRNEITDAQKELELDDPLYLLADAEYEVIERARQIVSRLASDARYPNVAAPARYLPVPDSPTLRPVA